MDSGEDPCNHLNEIIDQIGGVIVCTDCGLVLSNFYLTPNNYKEKQLNPMRDYVLEILSRLQMPDYFQHDILTNLEQLPIKFQKKENAAAFVIYKTLNDLKCGVSIKEISAVTGFTDCQIYDFQSHNETVIIEPTIQLEKYCIMLGLPKNSHSVIKENIKILQTGHNPSTVLATAIYKYCKQIKFPISMEKIAEKLNISTISIHRYLKLTKNES